MRNALALTALAAVISLPLITGPTSANASGTLLGGVGGALIGNSISRGAGGAIIGGLGGAVVGHEIAKSGCGSYRHTAYRSSRARYAERGGAPMQKIYYDRYGNPIVPPAPTYSR